MRNRIDLRAKSYANGIPAFKPSLLFVLWRKHSFRLTPMIPAMIFGVALFTIVVLGREVIGRRLRANESKLRIVLLRIGIEND
jgi:hypothetical protein